MTASELRIGNLVNYGNAVKQLDAELFLQLLKYTTPFEPIPLTEKWHNKFGVQKNGFLSFEYVLQRKNNIDITVVFQGDYVFLRQSSSSKKSIIDDDVVSIWNKDLTKRDIYVHEWQNLYFALVSEELTLKPHTDDCN
jgi:hypothetical protein